MSLNCPSPSPKATKHDYGRHVGLEAKRTNVGDLAGLPLDTMIYIQTFADPLDIIALRKCCKALFTASKSRTVWVNVLRRVCVDSNIFSRTFPIDNMSVLELEHACTSPRRFNRLLWRNLPNTIEPISTRIFKINTTRGSLDFSNIGALCKISLIPGGRYLITCTTEGLVQLWDLGFHVNMLITRSPLASVLVRGARETGLLVEHSCDGDRVLVAIESYVDLFWRITILEVLPQSATPEFRTVTVLIGGHSETITHATFFNEFLVFFVEGPDQTIAVWDFVRDMWARWDVSDTVHGIIVTRNEVLTTASRKLSVWRIPPLQSRIHGINTTVRQWPLISLVISCDRSMVPRSLWSWESLLHDKRHFCLLGLDGGSIFIERHLFQPMDAKKQTISSLPSCVPFKISRNHIDDDVLDYDGIMLPLSCKLPDGSSLAMWGHREDGIRVHLSSILETAEMNPVQVSGMLCEQRGQQKGYSCCPATGRLCLIESDDKVCIVDYLAPPPLRTATAGLRHSDE